MFDKLNCYLSGQNRSQVLRKQKLLQTVHKEISDKRKEIAILNRIRLTSAPVDLQELEFMSVQVKNPASKADGLEQGKHDAHHHTAQSRSKSHAKCQKEQFEIVRDQKSKQKLTPDQLNNFLQRNVVGPGFEDTYTAAGVRVCRKIEPELAKTIALQTAEEREVLEALKTIYNHQPMDEEQRKSHIKKIVAGETNPNYLKTYKEARKKASPNKQNSTPMVFGLTKTEFDSTTKSKQTESAKKLYSTSQERRDLVKKFLSGEDIFSHLKPTETLKNYSASRSKSPKKDNSKPPFALRKIDQETFASQKVPDSPQKLAKEQRKALMNAFLSNPKENLFQHQLCTKPARKKLSPALSIPFVPARSVPAPKYPPAMLSPPEAKPDRSVTPKRHMDSSYMVRKQNASPAKSSQLRTEPAPSSKPTTDWKSPAPIVVRSQVGNSSVVATPVPPLAKQESHLKGERKYMLTRV